VEQIKCRINDLEYTLDLEPSTFNCFWRKRNIHGRRTVILYWQQRTQFRNIISFRCLVFHLGRPWVTNVTGVRDLEENEEAFGVDEVSV